MKRFLSFVASAVMVVAAIAPRAARAEAPLRIKVVPPKQGEIASVKTSETVSGTVEVDGKSSPIAQTVDETYTEELLAVTGGVVTKAKVSFTSARGHTNQMGQQQAQDLPISGKTYVATAKDGKVTFLDDQGGDVGKAELDLLTKDIDNVGQPDQLGALLGAKKFVKGEKVTLSPAELRALMGANNDLGASDVVLTLQASDAKQATFALAGKLGGEQSGMTMSADFTGTVVIDVVRARLVEFDMHGTIDGTGEQQGHKIGMHAELIGDRHASYR